MSTNALDKPRSALAQARLAKDLQKAQELILKARSTATWRAYQSDWRQFEAYCRSVELPALPLQTHTIMAFLNSQAANGKSAATIQRRLIAMRLVNQAAGHPFPEDDVLKINELLKGIRRDQKYRPKNQKEAAVATDLMRMADRVDLQSHAGLRNRAILLFGFAGAFRRSELVGIQIHHLTFEKDRQGNDVGVKVKIPTSKGDQEGQGQTVAVLAEPGSPYCPVQTLRDWLTVAEITSGPVFLRMRRHDCIGKTAMTAQSVALIVKEHAERAGLEPAHYAGHSLRRGFLTTAAHEDKNIFKMAAHSRHKSLEVLREYVEDQQKFKNHAAEGLLKAPSTER